MASDSFMQALFAGFATEAQELCERITRDLLDLERAAPADAFRFYDSAARGLHTLKGTAATLGLEDLADLAHRMEDALAPSRKSLTALPGPVADVLLRALDGFLARVRAHADGRSDALGPIGEFVSLLSGLAPAPAPGLIATAPPVSESVLLLPDEVELASEAAAVEAAQTVDASSDSESWRVRVRDVFTLMREVDRMRELRLRLEQRRRELDALVASLSKIPGTEDACLALATLSSGLGSDVEEAGDIVDNAEEGLKIIGTVPVRTALEPLRRSARDLARQLGKEAKVSLVGADVALDRRVLEALRAPLVHLVRNAVDHGIELPSVREARGKHREGAITARVEQQGNMLFVTVEDDGGGLDVERIREVALARGVLTPERLAQLGTVQLQQLVFESGFSTRPVVTALSGRGVGLDVVRSQVEALDGHVEIHSVHGQFTRFTLTLPIEFGSSPLLAVRAGEHRFGLPIPAVESVVAAKRSDLRVGRSKVQLSHRDQLLPVHSLASLLSLAQPGAPQEGQPLLIMQSQGRRIALSVDEVLGDKDLVIRSLPQELREVPSYQGAATLAGGELLLVLRADWLVDHAAKPLGMAESMRRVLVVDDSLTARALHRTMLESGGFTVHTASSGAQALEQLKVAAYDVVVCDIGMEGMDGYAFTSVIRAKSETRRLPVILVSAHDSENDRSRGIASGADGFLSKKECVSGRLLSEISAVMTRRRAEA